MRIAVTGAVGQIGSRLFEQLARTHDVRGFDLRPGAGVSEVDLANPLAIDAMRGFQVIYHLAAAVSVAESFDQPVVYVRSNVTGTVNVLEAARRNDSRVVHVSTAAVYGETHVDPIPEEHPTSPTSVYGLSKLVAEQFVLLYRQLYGLKVAVVRPFNVYSESLPLDSPYAGVIARFLLNAANGVPLDIHGDGLQTRDFIHVSDVVQLLELLATIPESGAVYNCGTGNSISVLDLAKMVRKRFNPDLALRFTDARPGDIRHGRAAISRARQLGFDPHVRLEEWIRSVPVPKA